MTTPDDFLLAEYAQLKSEILKRSEFQHQLISIALVALGALAAVGLKDSPSALLAYPMLALFLGAAWSYNDIQIAQLGVYIRYRIEDQLIGQGLGWEHRSGVSESASKEIGALAKFATRGILWGSEFLAIGLYLLKRLSIGWPKPAERKGELCTFHSERRCHGLYHPDHAQSRSVGACNGGKYAEACRRPACERKLSEVVC